RREHRLTQSNFHPPESPLTRRDFFGLKGFFRVIFSGCWWRSSETGRRWRCFTTITRVGSALIKACSLGTGQCTSRTNCAAGDRGMVLAVHGAVGGVRSPRPSCPKPRHR
ncbi:unnamed protein product, partial [Ectocarpus sp. 6 AP-2014]